MVMSRRGAHSNRPVEITTVYSEEESDLFSNDIDSNNDRLLDKILRSHQTGLNGSKPSILNSDSTAFPIKTPKEGPRRETIWTPAVALPSGYESPIVRRVNRSIGLQEEMENITTSDMELEKLANAGDAAAKDPNLPIDQVIIFPKSPRLSEVPTVSRLRRDYRTGARSNIDNGVLTTSHDSFGRHSNDGLDVNAILLSLGLESDKSDSREGEHEGPLRRHPKRLQLSQKNQFRNGSMIRTTTKNALNVRAIFVVCLLTALVYTLLQETAVVDEHAKKFRSMALRRKRHFLRHEEGVDRPILDQRVFDHLKRFRNPGPVELNLIRGKVPVRDNGPQQFVDSQSSAEGSTDRRTQQITDAENSVENPMHPKIDQGLSNLLIPSSQENADSASVREKENAPSDALPPVIEEEVKTVAKAVENVLAETSDPQANEIPFFWFIPRSGASIVRSIASQCLGLTLASEYGMVDPNAERKSLQVVEVGGNKFVNVNLATVPGIVEARNLHLSESGLVDLVVSPRFPEAATLFSPTHKGRTFALLRHPVERAISMFFHLKKRNSPVVASLSIEEYAKSPHVENNWMTRMLTGKMSGEVGEFELAIAKKILQKKVVVGLLEQKDLSLHRFEYYLGWNYTHDTIVQGACRKRILTGDYRTNEISSHRIKDGSQAWSLLLWQNKLDLKLYKYAKALFLQQGAELFSEMPEYK